MGIDAVAVLRGRDLPLPNGPLIQSLDDPSDLVLRTLEDGVLVFTLSRFSTDVAQVALALWHSFGDALDAHRDPRGVFLFPDVAEPQATTYEGVIAEIGEGGIWVPVAGAAPAKLAAAEGDLAAPAATHAKPVALSARAPAAYRALLKRGGIPAEAIEAIMKGLQADVAASAVPGEPLARKSGVERKS